MTKFSVQHLSIIIVYRINFTCNVCSYPLIKTTIEGFFRCKWKNQQIKHCPKTRFQNMFKKCWTEIWFQNWFSQSYSDLLEASLKRSPWVARSVCNELYNRWLLCPQTGLRESQPKWYQSWPVISAVALSYRVNNRGFISQFLIIIKNFHTSKMYSLYEYY